MSLNPRQLTVRAPRVARREPGWRRAARRYWPLGVAGTGALGWYAADSLRHRREGAFGYEIATEIDVGSEEFTRAAEALTGAPITTGNHAELLINGDRIFPRSWRPSDRPSGRSTCRRTSTGAVRSPTTSPGRSREGGSGRPLQGHPRRARSRADGAPPDR